MESDFYNGYDGQLGAKDIFETLESFYNDYDKNYNNRFIVNNAYYYYFMMTGEDTYDEIEDEMNSRLSGYIKQHNLNASSNFNLQNYYGNSYGESYYNLFWHKNGIGSGYDEVQGGNGYLCGYYLTVKDTLTNETLQEVFLGYAVENYYN